jgi:hypothetical protein
MKISATAVSTGLLRGKAREALLCNNSIIVNGREQKPIAIAGLRRD